MRFLWRAHVRSCAHNCDDDDDDDIRRFAKQVTSIAKNTTIISVAFDVDGGNLVTTGEPPPIPPTLRVTLTQF